MELLRWRLLCCASVVIWGGAGVDRSIRMQTWCDDCYTCTIVQVVDCFGLFYILVGGTDEMRASSATRAPQRAKKLHSSSWLRSFALPFVTFTFSCGMTNLVVIMRTTRRVDHTSDQQAWLEGASLMASAARLLLYNMRGAHLCGTVNNCLPLQRGHVVCDLCCVRPALARHCHEFVH